MSENNYNPEALPDVHDEAPDTASWVPVMGVIIVLAVFTAIALTVSGSAHSKETHNTESTTHGK